MASDDDDDSLAQFLESEVLSEISDQEDEKREEEIEDRVAKTMLYVEDDSNDEVEEVNDARNVNEEEDISEEIEMRKEEEENEEEEEKEVNKMLIEEGGTSCCEDEGNELGNDREVKRRRIEEVDCSNNERSMMLIACNMLSTIELGAPSLSSKRIGLGKGKDSNESSSDRRPMPNRMDTGDFSKVPPELFRNIFKFLSSEDLVSCSLVCRFLNFAASDESLWRRLYSLRWGLLPPEKLRECAWKKLYIQRDEEDVLELVRNCPPEFKEYYIQMQAAKRSQAPLPSQVLDEQIIIDKTITDQVSIWKSSRGLTDKMVPDHACSGETCTYYHIGDVFVCEKTGNVHVCDDTCKEVVADPANELLVCTISGRCFDRLLSPSEMDPEEQQQGGVADEAEPFMGSGRFARAYLLGYNCTDEKELEATLRFC